MTIIYLPPAPVHITGTGTEAFRGERACSPRPDPRLPRTPQVRVQGQRSLLPEGARWQVVQSRLAGMSRHSNEWEFMDICT